MAMRLAAQAKMGYYPVNPKTLSFITSKLTVNDPTKCMILDPCCGEGRALEYLATRLGVPRENTFGVELDDKRAEDSKQCVGTVLNASFFGTRIIPYDGFSLAWVNPPYEDEAKQADNSDHNRQLEVAFINRAAYHLVPGGVMLLHMPIDRITRSVMAAFYTLMDNCFIHELPDHCRPYREAVVVGVRRKKSVASHYVDKFATRACPPELVIPNGDVIRKFYQDEPTDKELEASLSAAPFLSIFRRVPRATKMRPVMPLGAGHIGLTLASGLLDGYLEPAGWEPHVVRGVAYKEPELAKDETTVDEETGKTTNTKTYRENIKLKIRAVTSSGDIVEIL